MNMARYETRSIFHTTKRLVAALKRIGFDYVFDTNFAADLNCTLQNGHS